MENPIFLFISFFALIICIATLIRDIKIDKETDRIESLSMYEYENPFCTEKSEHCDYCGTDNCIFHPNND
jgi:hypothetical protein